MYKDKQIPMPYVGEWAEINNKDEATIIDTWRGKIDDDKIKRARMGYYGNVTFIDHQIGRLLYEMKHTFGVLDNTFIIFISDHGDMLGDHYLWRKTYAYEGSVKIPCVMLPHKDFECHRGKVIDNVVELRDIMPTILDVAGVKIPETCDGKSVLPLLRGEEIEWRKYIQGEHCKCYHYEQENYYVTDGKYKYIWFDNIGTEQFFDLTNDPGEIINQIDNPQYKGISNIFRNYLIYELEQRDCGLVENGKLKQKLNYTNIMSPHYNKYGCND